MATFIDSTIKIQRKRDITRRDLDVFFQPRSVAVIGATDRAGHVGRTVLWNLISSPFGGTVYPVNPKRSSVLGIKAYPNVASLPEPPELAVIMTPAETVPGVIEECAARRSARRGGNLGWLSRGRPPRVSSWNGRSSPRRARPRCGSSGRTAWASCVR